MIKNDQVTEKPEGGETTGVGCVSTVVHVDKVAHPRAAKPCRNRKLILCDQREVPVSWSPGYRYQ